jgi:MFS family permease
LKIIGPPLASRTLPLTVPSLRSNLRALPKPTWILFLGMFINRFGSFVMPFLAIYTIRIGYSVTQAGLAVSAYGAGHIVASLLGGSLADRFGRRNTIAFSMFSSAAAMLALSQARTLHSLIILTFFAGASTELYRPAATALLGDLVSPEQRVTAFGMYRFAVNLGFAAGPATAGFLANYSFLYLFVGDAITSFIFGIVALVALPHGKRSTTRNQVPAEALRSALRDRTFVLFLIGTLCMTSVEYQIHSTVPLHIQASGHTPATYGLLLSINGVMIVLFELALTSWTQKFRPQRVIAIGYALASIGVALTGAAHSVLALSGTVVVWTLGEMIFAPQTGAFVTGLAPEQYRGRYMGLWISMWSMGMLLGPTIGTWVFARDERMLWIGCAIVGLIGAWLPLVREREVKPAVSLADEAPL